MIHRLRIMKFSLLSLSILIASLFVSPVGWAQESVPQPIVAQNVIPPVEVRGTKDPDWKPYRTMLKGHAAFQSNQSLAPYAPFHFILRPVDLGTSLVGVSLRLADNDNSISIPVTEDGIFDLPLDGFVLQENAELILNRKKNSILWRPYIRTPGLHPQQRRLGDLRLECSIIWAVEYDDIPFLIRNTFRLVGGPCKSTKIAVFFDAPQALISATISSGDHRELLMLSKNKRAFMPPLGDKSWSDDSLIELMY
jgi:hypothetical protein